MEYDEACGNGYLLEPPIGAAMTCIYIIVTASGSWVPLYSVCVCVWCYMYYFGYIVVKAFRCCTYLLTAIIQCSDLLYCFACFLWVFSRLCANTWDCCNDSVSLLLIWGILVEIFGGFVLHNCPTLCGTQAMSVQLLSALSKVMHPTEIPISLTCHERGPMFTHKNGRTKWHAVDSFKAGWLLLFDLVHFILVIKNVVFL